MNETSEAMVRESEAEESADSANPCRPANWSEHHDGSSSSEAKMPD